MTYQEYIQHLNQLESELAILQLAYDEKEIAYDTASEQLKDKKKEIKEWEKSKVDDYPINQELNMIVGDVIQFSEKYDPLDIKKDDRFIIMFGCHYWHNYTAKIFNDDILGDKEIKFSLNSNDKEYINPSILLYVKTMEIQFI